MWNQTSKKFIGGFLGIIFLSLATLYITQTYFSPERQAERRLAELERQYAEDTYGGTTPEETLELFIDALKAGDIELASKYFVIDEQVRWLDNLKKIKENESLDDMLLDLNREKYKYLISDGQVGFDIANDQKEVALTILIGRGPNGIWKIISM